MFQRKIEAKIAAESSLLPTRSNSDSINGNIRHRGKRHDNIFGKDRMGNVSSSKARVQDQLDRYERKIQAKITSDDKRGGNKTRKNNDRTRKKKELSKMDMYEKSIQAKVNAGS